MKPFFYVELKISKKENNLYEPLLPGFDDENDRLLKNFTENKKYPVINIIDDENIQIPDDNGILQIVSSRLFKFSDDI